MFVNLTTNNLFAHAPVKFEEVAKKSNVSPSGYRYLSKCTSNPSKNFRINMSIKSKDTRLDAYVPVSQFVDKKDMHFIALLAYDIIKETGFRKNEVLEVYNLATSTLTRLSFNADHTYGKLTSVKMDYEHLHYGPIIFTTDSM